MDRRDLFGPTLIFLASTILSIGLSTGCTAEDDVPPTRSTLITEFDGEVASSWINLLLEQIEAEAKSPPVASRILAYSSVAMYEAVVDGAPKHLSLGEQLNGLGSLPSIHNGRQYDFISILHGTMGHLTPLFFRDDESRTKLIDFAEAGLQERREAGIDDDVITRSVNRGILIAEIIDSWAWNDGYPFIDNGSFSPPNGDHVWVPTGDYDDPLEPYWGTLRPFVLASADICKPPAPVEYSTEPESDFYQQAFAVWEISQNLGEDQRHIARFWADDPGVTATPPGHWMALAAQISDEQELSLADTTELFALLGITGADSFVSCWDEKYRSYLIRPVTYIQKFIDDQWEPLIGTPPFPEYTSGHSNVSASSARILTALLGEFPFEDRVHQERGLGTREFDNFSDAAQEAAFSRLYGGIHYPMGIDHGLPQGECVAGHVLDRVQTSVE